METDANPHFSYTAEEEPHRRRFLAENPDWDCKKESHIVGPIDHEKGLTGTGCCWVCGKAVC